LVAKLLFDWSWVDSAATDVGWVVGLLTGFPQVFGKKIDIF
jgi:hypothetical protein